MAKTMDDAFVPECTTNGSYAEMQCFAHDGFAKQCWCVTSDGQEIQGTRMSDGQIPKCTAADRAAEENKTVQSQLTTQASLQEFENNTKPGRSTEKDQF